MAKFKLDEIDHQILNMLIENTRVPFTDIAKKNNVYVTRTYYDNSGKATNTKTYEVNVEALNKGTLSSDSPQRFWIYPGDRIQVPERLF